MSGAPTYSYKGPIYDPEKGEWNDVPIYPQYMETTHYSWLGIQKPDLLRREPPRVICLNGDAPCTEGALYIFIALDKDGLEGDWSTLMKDWEYEIVPKFCTSDFVDRNGISQTMVIESNGRLKMGVPQGIRIREVNRCMGSAGWVWLMKPRTKLKTYGEYSVTATMSTQFDIQLELHKVEPKSLFFRS